ncbi:MAG: ATP-binding protein [Candidatus Paceibacterota bacterium]
MKLNFIDQFRARSGGSPKAFKDTDTLWTTPWQWRDEEGTYIGFNGQVWLYRTLPLSPVQWEDPGTRISIGQQLSTLLVDIGATSTAPVAGLKQFANNREIHIISVTWETQVTTPESTPAPLKEYLNETLRFAAPNKSLVLGVRLRPSVNSSHTTLLDQAKKIAAKTLLEDVPDRTAYAQDRDFIISLCARFGGRAPIGEELDQIESWFNAGRGCDTTIIERSTTLEVPAFDTFEVSAVMRFGNPVMQSPSSQWVLEAASHPHGPSVISIRAELEPSVVTRSRSRRSQRRIDASIKEEAAAGDLERVEYAQTFQLAKELETFLVDVGEPILTNCSILLVRKVRPSDETYIDFLRSQYGIEVKPLEHRQLRALDETLPCSSRRVNPFLQDVSISMLAHSGLTGFSNLGDKSGLYVGLSMPDNTPVYLEPSAAARENVAPGMLVAGDPGSGKTFLCQSLAIQSVLAGTTTIFINPKGFDSLASFAKVVNGAVVKMSALEAQPGAFDPFRYAPAPVAAEIATNHILSVLGNDGGFTQSQQLELGSALKRAAQSGARCVADAFDLIEDRSIVTQIKQQVEGSSLFALGVGLTPLAPLGGIGGLTLIEFDRKLDLPEPSKSASVHTRPERISLAAIRLVTRAAMEILMSTGGGVLVVDEAWTFLGHAEGLAAMQQLGREGRSLNVLPIFATQRIADVISRDMETYISRVFCMKLSEAREATAALTLCGLEPTQQRISWLRECGPRRGEEGFPDRPALSLHRDLRNRHSAVMIGPVPERIRIAISTNLDDRLNRDESAGSGSDSNSIKAEDGGWRPVDTSFNDTGSN